MIASRFMNMMKVVKMIRAIAQKLLAFIRPSIMTLFPVEKNWKISKIVYTKTVTFSS
jgi:hypothetical protein